MTREMKDIRPRVASFLSQAKPIEQPRFEERKAFVFGGQTYLIEDNKMKWWASEIIQWCKATGIPIVTVTVQVSLVIEEPEEKEGEIENEI